MCDLNSYEEGLATDLAKAEAHIKALTEELAYWQEDSAAGWDKCEENRIERDALAEKLAKAVKALKEIAEQTKGVTPEPDNLQMAIGSIHSYARATLAAIKEKTDD